MHIVRVGIMLIIRTVIRKVVFKNHDSGARARSHRGVVIRLIIRARFDRVTLIREVIRKNYDQDSRQRSVLYRTSADCVAAYEIGKVQVQDNDKRSPTLTSGAIFIMDGLGGFN